MAPEILFPPETTDHELVTRVRGGDIHAYEHIISAYYSFLIAYATNVLRSEADASDLLQDVFLSLWDRRESWTLTTTLRAYLVGAVSRRISDYFRSNHRTRQREERYAADAYGDGIERLDAAQHVENSELSAAVRHAIDTLPPKAREVWILRRLEGMTVPEVAHALGISENTVKTHLARGIGVLRKTLAPFWLKHIS